MEETKGKEEFSIGARDMCMHEFSWHDPTIVVNNDTNRILPGNPGLLCDGGE